MSSLSIKKKRVLKMLSASGLQQEAVEQKTAVRSRREPTRGSRSFRYVENKVSADSNVKSSAKQMVGSVREWS